MPSRGDIVAAALRWCGTPFHHRAAIAGVGCDCLGLVRGIYSEFYGTVAEPLPAYGPDGPTGRSGEPLLEGLARYLVPVLCEETAQGDVIAFRWRPHLPVSHLGIATGVHSIIHAHRRGGVCEVALVPAWRRRIAACYRFPWLED